MDWPILSPLFQEPETHHYFHLVQNIKTGVIWTRLSQTHHDYFPEDQWLFYFILCILFIMAVKNKSG
jgi:hypothetical protein